MYKASKNMSESIIKGTINVYVLGMCEACGWHQASAIYCKLPAKSSAICEFKA